MSLSVLNKLPSDSEYPNERGSEPYRNKEVLQTWDALKSLCNKILPDDTTGSLSKLQHMVDEAEEYYDQIRSVGIQLEPRSGSEHLDAIAESIERFKKLAEIDS